MEINSSDRNMRPSSENSPAQASGSQGAVKKVTNNPSLLYLMMSLRLNKITAKQKIESDFNALLYGSMLRNRFKQQATDLGDAAGLVRF
ncbi:hypothetical protein Tco_1551622 [Tanacetum coccineum]